MSQLSTAAGDVVDAGFLRRWAAFFVDSLILTAGFYGLLTIMFVILGASGGFEAMARLDSEDPPPWFWAAYGGASLLYFVGAALYYSVMESSASQATVGKMALSIKVTNLEGGRLSWPQALLRWVAAALSYVTLYIGFLMAAFTERKQALHDIVVGTRVVDKWAYTEFPERQQRGLSGCLVAFMIGIGLMILLAVLGIVAAIAIPAYHGYSERAKVIEAIGNAGAVKVEVAVAVEASGECPDNTSEGFAPPESYASQQVRQIEVYGLDDGRCAVVIDLTFPASLDPEQRWVELALDRQTRQWSCRSALPDNMLPAHCRG
jgi:uncharacterized RDD family membrane protein YckC/type II secretory pathway pseudopilin PulG